MTRAPDISETLFIAAPDTAPFAGVRVMARDGRIAETTLEAESIPAGEPIGPAAREAVAWLHAYMRREFRPVAFPLAPPATAFEARVRAAMLAIPAGRTETYGGVAARVDGVARAVGGACGRNPIPVIVPCHRVVSSAGDGGFSATGGLAVKRWLLAHEAGQRVLAFDHRRRA